MRPCGGASCMPPLRILLVSETYPPEINGVAMTTQRLFQGLRARGNWVGLVRPRQRREGTATVDTWTVPSLPLPNYPGLRLGLPAWIRLRHLIAAQRPDVVHVVTEGPLGWAAVWAARSMRVPVTSGYHTHFDQYSGHYGLTWLGPWVQAWLMGLHRRCQATLVPTRELAASLRGRGIPNVQVVGRGVDTQQFHPDHRDAALRETWGVRADDLVCLYVGRLAPEKNLAVVERAFAAIAARHPRARMVWVGDGPSLPRLRAAHPEQVFAGPQIGHALSRHYASADLFLFASLSETWGNVIGEALASGLAVVAYRRAAGEMLIRNEENGLSVRPGGSVAFIAAALALANDADTRTRLAVAARDSMGEQGWSQVLECLETILRDAATLPSPVRPPS